MMSTCLGSFGAATSGAAASDVMRPGHDPDHALSAWIVRQGYNRSDERLARDYPGVTWRITLMNHDGRAVTAFSRGRSRAPRARLACLIGLTAIALGPGHGCTALHRPTSVNTPVTGVIVHDDCDAWLHEAATVTHPPLNELSGIDRSETYPGLWWVHNDSGDEPRLYAIDAEGKVVIPVWRRDAFYAGLPEDGKQPWRGICILNGANQDWEDIVADDGTLYVADVGNNGNAKRDLGFYIVNEPNPAAMDQDTRALSFIPIAYPDQHDYPPLPPDDWRFDCEAVFIRKGRLYLLTKYRADNRFDRITTGTSLYRLDTMHTDRVNVLTLIHRADDLPIIPMSADLSPDGTRLAVMSFDGVWLFEKPRRGDDWLAGRVRHLRLPRERIKQAEGVCWDDGRTLRIVNEQRGVLTLDLSALQPGP